MNNIQDRYIYIKLFTRLYVRVGILLTCEKYLKEPIIPLRGEVWALKTSFTSILFIEVPVPSQEGGGHVCGCQFCRFFDFVIGFWNCFADSVVFFLSSFYWLLNPRHTKTLYMSHENIYCNTKLIYSTVLDTTQLLHRHKTNIGNNWQKLICQYS